MATEEANQPRGRAPWYVWAAIVAALGIFVLSSFVIYYRFMTTPETNCVIVVNGNRDLEGGEVVVERVTTGDDTLRLADKLTADNLYSVRFFLHSATYKIEVWTREKMLLVTYPDEFVPPGSRLSLDLGRLRLSATQPIDRGRR